MYTLVDIQQNSYIQYHDIGTTKQMQTRRPHNISCRAL